LGNEEAMRITAIDLPTDSLRLDDLARGLNVVHLPYSRLRRDVLAAIRAAMGLSGSSGDPVAQARVRMKTPWGRAQWTSAAAEGSESASPSARLRRVHRKLRASVRRHECGASIGSRWANPADMHRLALLLTTQSPTSFEQSAISDLWHEWQTSRQWRSRDELVQTLRARESELLAQIEHTLNPQVRTVASPRQRRHADRWQSRLNRIAVQLDVVDRMWRRILLQRSTIAEKQRQTQIMRLEQQIERLQLVLEDVHGRLRRIAQRRTENNANGPAWDRELSELEECRVSLQRRLDLLTRRKRQLDERKAAEHRLVKDSLFVRRLQQKQSRLEQRKRLCQERLKALRERGETSVAPTEAGLPASADPQQIKELHSQLDEVRKQLQAQAESEARDASVVWQRLRKSMRQNAGSQALELAGRHLRRLTDQQFTGLRLDPANCVWHVELADGGSVPLAVLSQSERVQVHFALCLAISAELARRGFPLPLVLNDVTRFLPTSRLAPALDMLRDHGRTGQQILLLTSQSHVASLCRSLGAVNFAWPVGEPGPAQPERVEREPHRRPAGTRQREKPICETNSWDCEEFPGELRDRVRRDGLSGAALPTPEDRDATARQPGSIATTPACTKDGQCAPEELRSSGHYLELCDRVTEIPFVARDAARAIESIGVYTVANLLHADASRLSQRLADHPIAPAEVRQWQAQARLMCGVSRMRSYDARVLVACGVTTPEQLADIRPRELLGMIEAFVATAEGSQIVRDGHPREVARLSRWMQSLQRTRRSRPAPSHSVRAPRIARESAQVVPPRAAPAEVWSPKFYLETGSQVEAAPSIGPTMAKRLQSVGVHTVGDLLGTDAVQLAKKLAQRRVSAATIQQWQAQAGLVCRIPELHGHDAQLLVACEVASAESLAGSNADRLFQKVTKLAKSKAGRRILRGGTEPTSSEVLGWIRSAAKARKLAA
jgi:hypothetical protein